MVLADEPHRIADVNVTVAHSGAVVTITTEQFAFGEQQVKRDVVRHPGSVGLVALRSHHGRCEILLVRQYRHPMASYMWELPAGLRDVQDEDPRDCARRELLEETGYDCGELELLVESATSPGGSDEVITLFVTRDVTPALERPRTADAEEQDMVAQWYALSDVVAAIQQGHLRNAALQVGVLFGTLWARESGLPAV